MGKPVGGADDHDLLADPHCVGVAYRGHSHGRCDTLELQERDIGARTGRDAVDDVGAVMTLPSLETRTPEPVSLKRVTPPALT